MIKRLVKPKYQPKTELEEAEEAVRFWAEMAPAINITVQSLLENPDEDILY